MAFEKNNPERKKLIEKIRKEGDFISGEYIPVQEKLTMQNSEDTSCILLPCIHCKGQSQI